MDGKNYQVGPGGSRDSGHQGPAGGARWGGPAKAGWGQKGQRPGGFVLGVMASIWGPASVRGQAARGHLPRTRRVALPCIGSGTQWHSLGPTACW